jgi:hypothetical protein
MIRISKCVRYCGLVCFVIPVLAVCTGSCARQTFAQEESAQDASILPYVDKSVDLLFIARPHQIFSSSDYQKVKQAGGEYFERTVGQTSDLYFKLSLAELKDIEQITFVAFFDVDQEGKPTPGENEQYNATILRMVNDNADQFELATHDVAETFEYKGKEYFKGKYRIQGTAGYICIVDERTLILAGNKTGIEKSIDAGTNGAKSARWYKGLVATKRQHFNVVMEEKMLGTLRTLRLQTLGLPLDFECLKNVEYLTADVKLGLTTELSVTANCDQAKNAKPVMKLCEQVLELLWQQLQAQENVIKESSISIVYSFFHDLLDSANIKNEGKQVQVNAKFDLDLSKLQNVFEDFYTGQARINAANNLRQIMTSLHIYHDRHGRFPPSICVSDSGKKYSWRVEILPFMEEQALYNQYRFDEEWDSPNNQRVTARMPDFFRSDLDDKETTNTAWFLVTGPGCAIGSNESLSLQEISDADGTALTIVAVETKRNVHWAKPEDIAIGPTNRLPKLGGFHAGGFNAGFANASVQFIDENVPAETILKLFTYNGGEPVDAASLQRKRK